MTFGDKIRIRREQLGMSQRKLAFEMGYNTNSTIKRIESGEIDPPLSKVEKFSEVLNVPLSWLCGYDEQIPDPVPQKTEVLQLLETATEDEKAEIARYIKYVLSQREQESPSSKS